MIANIIIYKNFHIIYKKIIFNELIIYAYNNNNKIINYKTD